MDTAKNFLGKFHNGIVYFKDDPTPVVLRTLAGIKITPRHRENTTSAVSCNVFGVEDSIFGIFEAIRLAVLDCSIGGFQCLDFTKVRPNGTPVLDTGGIASGPVSFLKVWDAGVANANSIIKGFAILRYDHTDIEEWKAYHSDNLIVGWYEPAVGWDTRNVENE